MTSMNNLVQQFYKSDHVQGFLPTLTTQRFPLCNGQGRRKFVNRTSQSQKHPNESNHQDKKLADASIKQILCTKLYFILEYRYEGFSHKKPCYKRATNGTFILSINSSTVPESNLLIFRIFYVFGNETENELFGKLRNLKGRNNVPSPTY